MQNFVRLIPWHVAQHSYSYPTKPELRDNLQSKNHHSLNVQILADPKKAHSLTNSNNTVQEICSRNFCIENCKFSRFPFRKKSFQLPTSCRCKTYRETILFANRFWLLCFCSNNYKVHSKASNLKAADSAKISLHRSVNEHLQPGKHCTTPILTQYSHPIKTFSQPLLLLHSFFHEISLPRKITACVRTDFRVMRGWLRENKEAQIKDHAKKSWFSYFVLLCAVFHGSLLAICYHRIVAVFPSIKLWAKCEVNVWQFKWKLVGRQETAKKERKTRHKFNIVPLTASFPSLRRSTGAVMWWGGSSEMCVCLCEKALAQKWNSKEGKQKKKTHSTLESRAVSEI